jgi:spermidine synthase
LVFGSTTAAVTTVLAVFFGGLAIGSALFGRVAQRTDRPLRLYALLEIALAVAIVLSLPGFVLVEGVFGAAYRALGDGPVALPAGRLLLVGLVLLVPTVLMGGTLPLLCRHFVVAGSRSGGRVGLLYGINTLGAALGCALAGLVLIPGIGVRASLLLAAGLDLLAGVAVLAARPRERPLAPEATAPAPGGRRDRALVGAMFFGTGFVALGIEVVWTRHLALIVPNTVYTYTITLTAVLVGIVLGAWLAALLADRVRSRPLVFALLQGLTALAILIVLRLAPSTWRGMDSEVAVAFGLLLPAAVLSGASFPIAVRMVLDDPSRAGIRVGTMAAVNTLGGIGGAMAAGFVGLPMLGIDVSARALSAVSLTIGLAAAALAWRALPARRRAAVATAGIAAVVAWLVLPMTMTTRVPADFLAEADALVDYEEGVASNLAVVRKGESLHLEIDRWWQGESRRNHQAMTAHIPMLLHGNARRVLVVGVGTGQTPARFLLHPVERLDCVDIEPALYGFVRDHFDAAWMDDERTRLLEADGRNYVTHTSETYDVISLEVGQLFRPGIATFYTVDFYERAAARLAAGGIVAQLVPLPFLDEETFRRVVATFVEVFPTSVLWYNTSELILIGFDAERVAISVSSLAERMAAGAVGPDLAWSYWGGPEHDVRTPERFLGGFLCGPRGLAALAGGRPVLTDDRPVLEYATRGASPHQRNELPLVELLRGELDVVGFILAEAVDAETAAAIGAMRALNVGDMSAQANLRLVELTRDRIALAQATALLEEALRWNPHSFACHRQLASIHARAGRFEEARRHFERALAARESDVESLRGLGFVLIQLGRQDEAADHLRRLVDDAPDDAVAHNYLGVALAGSGDVAGAVEHFRAAARLAPYDEQIRRNLQGAEAALQAPP